MVESEWRNFETWWLCVMLWVEGVGWFFLNCVMNSLTSFAEQSLHQTPKFVWWKWEARCFVWQGFIWFKCLSCV